MKVVHVAVGVIVDPEGRILITRRAAQAHQGDLWEFPGGKAEAGESTEQALTRELLEELGIVVVRTTALLEVRHDYPDKSVLLDVHIVWEFTGEAKGLEHQPLCWVAPDQLSSYAFPAANVPIVDTVSKMFT